MGAAPPVAAYVRKRAPIGDGEGAGRGNREGAGHRTRCEPQWRRVHTYTRAIGLLDQIKRLLTGAKDDAETLAEGGEPVATPPGGEERETSTNAQMMGSSDEPWSGND